MVKKQKEKVLTQNQFLWYSKLAFIIGIIILSGIGTAIYYFRKQLGKFFVFIGGIIDVCAKFIWKILLIQNGALFLGVLWAGLFYFLNYRFADKSFSDDRKYWQKNKIGLFFVELLLFVLAGWLPTAIYLIINSGDPSTNMFVGGLLMIILGLSVLYIVQ